MCKLFFLSFLLFVSAVSSCAQDVGTYLRLTPEQQDGLVRKIAIRAATALTAPMKPGLTPEEANVYEQARLMGNLTKVLFTDEPSDTEKAPGFEDIRIRVNNLSKQGKAADLVDVITDYVTHRDEQFEKDDKTLLANLPYLSSLPNKEQENYFRHSSLRLQESLADSLAAIAASNREYHKKSDKMLEVANGWRDIAKADLVRISLRKLALSDPYPDSQNRIDACMNNFVPRLRELRTGNVTSLASRLDSRGRQKSEQTWAADQSRASQITKLFESYDESMLAAEIHPFLKSSGQVDLRAIMVKFFGERLAPKTNQ